MGTLIPGERIQHFQKNGIVYSYYPDNPDIEPWESGYIEKKIFTYATWVDMNEKAKHNKTLKQYMDKALDIYFMIKDDKEK